MLNKKKETGKKIDKQIKRFCSKLQSQLQRCFKSLCVNFQLPVYQESWKFMLCDKILINHLFLLQLSCGNASLMNSKQLLKIVTGFARTS